MYLGKMVKKKGIISGNYESEFAIMGIACHLNDYRIIHFLNKILDFNFIRYDDLMVYQKNNENPLAFPFYYFNDTETHTYFHFISNRSPDGIMINKWKQIDYVLVVLGSLHNIDLKSIIKQIKKIPNVLAVSEMPLTKKPEIENLMTDIELHVIEILKKEKEEEKKVINKLRVKNLTSSKLKK